MQISGLSRSTYYYHAKQENEPDKYSELKRELCRIYHENYGRYGYRRITMSLHNLGYTVNHKTVQRLMKELELVCRVRAKKYQSYKGEEGRVAPNLLERDFSTTAPNQKWTTDITEFKLFGKRLYLLTILDLHRQDKSAILLKSVRCSQWLWI